MAQDMLCLDSHIDGSLVMPSEIDTSISLVSELDKVGSDISTATTTNLKVKKPDGTEVTWTGSIYLTQKIRYTIASGDWDQAGQYRLQAYVEMPGWTGLGDVALFDVEDEYR